MKQSIIYIYINFLLREDSVEQHNIATITTAVVPRSVPLILLYMSNLDYLANISLAGYLTLFSLWFFTVDSACTSQEDLLLLLRTLLHVLHKTLFLIYNTGARNYFSINFPAFDFYTTTRTSDDLNDNNNKLTADSYITIRTSGEHTPKNN